jgi:aminoglycoside phosphotransferase family enzyme/predicted kinase
VGAYALTTNDGPVTTMSKSGQDEVINFLGDRCTHHMTSAPVRIETHGAFVFLADENVYKIKRAVTYPYMDFSTLNKRRAACEAEVEINRRYAPDLYLGTIPITRDQGQLKLNGTGEVVEWAVHMRRFDESATFDRLAAASRLTAEMIDLLAEAVASSHQTAPVHFVQNASEQMENILVQTLAELKKRCGQPQAGLVKQISEALWHAFRENKSILSQRAGNGHVRHCHGDLHLANIVLIADKPVLFDAIEFDPSFAIIDTLYDLSFLVMDICCQQLRPLACRLLNRYLWRAESIEQNIAGLALLPLFLAVRACIRASVLTAKLDLTGDEKNIASDIRMYFSNAMEFLAPSNPIIVAIGGVSGTGKSTLSDILSSHLAPRPGAIQLRSDIERKRMQGVDQYTHLNDNAYRPAITEAVYARLLKLTAVAVRARRSVVIDATFMEEATRGQIAQLASQIGVPFFGIWLTATDDILKARLAARVHDASDATAAVLDQQLNADIGYLDWHIVDSSQSPIDAVRQILSIISLPGVFSASSNGKLT